MSKSKQEQALVEPLEPGGSRLEGGKPEVVTIEEHGPRTVSGTPVVVQFRPSNVLMRRELGMISARRDLKAQPGRLHLLTLATCIKFLGDTDLTGLSDQDKVASLADTMNVGDIGYLTTYRAFERAGQRFRFPWGVTCQGCGERLKARSIEVDLGTLKLARYATPPAIHYRLNRTWELGPDTVVEVTLGSPSARRALLELTQEEWDIEDLAEIREVAAAITHMTRRGPDGKDRRAATVVTPSMLNAMHEDDLDFMALAVGGIRGGSARSIEWTHDVCGKLSLLPLDWRSDFFAS